METPSPRYVRARVSNACDSCKQRKVKCDGNTPCRYCADRGRSVSCVYSPQKKRRVNITPKASQQNGSSSSSRRRDIVSSSGSAVAATTTASQPRREPAAARDAAADEQDDTEVPREARLLRDSQGKLVFIGDCAPLSFFQSVRRLVTSKVSHDAFAPETSRFSVLENATGRRARTGDDMPSVDQSKVDRAVSVYLATTAGLVDFLDDGTMRADMAAWARSSVSDAGGLAEDDVVIKYLILAIGLLGSDDEELAHDYFGYARDRAYGDLSGDLSVGTVQAFTLVTVFMLCSCQINGAFLFFGIAVRAAYSIGLHRTEVNARFGSDVGRSRDMLWRSLRVVDLYLSTSMGRPPVSSDVDCTVSYRAQDSDGNEVLSLLNAQVQILLITETIVLEIFSRRKVSLALTEGISVKLRSWSERWLQRLKGVVESRTGSSAALAGGACQVLATYYYSVMLVSRPFLMYELYKRLSDGPVSARGGASGKTKLADACIDAASLMVDTVMELVHRNMLSHRSPMLVSWLFAASLVLGVGLMGGFGRILERYSRMSIQALDHFAMAGDGHAAQYSLVAQSLLKVALEELDKREMRERLARSENSSLLFGLVPPTAGDATPVPQQQQQQYQQYQQQQMQTTTLPMDASITAAAGGPDRPFHSLNTVPATSSPRMLGEMDSAYLGLSESLLHTPEGGFWNGGFDGDAGSALNLFPLMDAGGGIDLAHYF